MNRFDMIRLSVAMVTIYNEHSDVYNKVIQCTLYIT